MVDDSLTYIPPLEGATRGEKIWRLQNCQCSVVVARLGLSHSIYHHGQTTDDGSVMEGGGRPLMKLPEKGLYPERVGHKIDPICHKHDKKLTSTANCVVLIPKSFTGTFFPL
jgi:hypothetical protein